MKFDIVDRDTTRVVGAVSIDEGQFANAVVDREERNKPSSGSLHTVVSDDGVRTTFATFGEALRFALRFQTSHGPFDITPTVVKAGKVPELPNRDRLARFDNWSNTEFTARKEFGEFYPVFNGKVAIERMNADTDREYFVAFNIHSGDAKLFETYPQAAEWCYGLFDGEGLKDLVEMAPNNPFDILFATLLKGV